MSFYRKYRPQVIGEVDNIQVREKLLSLMSKDRSDLPHAYLFSGPKGAGKTTSARLIAKLFNCQKLSKTGPCGTCDQCEAIKLGANTDVLEIDAASNRGIDEIRQLRDRIGFMPSQATYTVYIIDEVHMLTTEAFNALLKTLEEPPMHAVFILATTDPQKVPATIKSRCMHIQFGRASDAELTEALKRIIAEEKLTIDEDAVSQIVAYSEGSFRDGVKLLEQVSLEKGQITKETISRILSVTDTALIEKFIDFLKNGNTKENTRLQNDRIPSTPEEIVEAATNGLGTLMRTSKTGEIELFVRKERVAPAEINLDIFVGLTEVPAPES